MPRHPNQEQIRRVFDTGQGFISGFYIGAISSRPRISVYAPVVEKGWVVYVINIGMDSARLGQILRNQQLPSDWLVSIVDSSGTISARNRTPELFVGEKAPPDILQRFSDFPEGSMMSWTKERIPALVVFSRSQVTGWRVVSAIPTESLEAPLLRSLSLIAMGLAAVFSLGLALAWLVGARMACSVGALAASAFRLGAGQNAPAPKVYISHGPAGSPRALNGYTQILEENHGRRLDGTPPGAYGRSAWPAARWAISSTAS